MLLMNVDEIGAPIYVKGALEAHCAAIKTSCVQTALCVLAGARVSSLQPISDPIPASVNVKFIPSLCLPNSSVGSS